jgi:ligand-binding sensor domain-containing protein
MKYNTLTGEKQTYLKGELGSEFYNFQFKSIGCYQDEVYVGTSNGLYQLTAAGFVECKRGYMQKIVALQEFDGSLWVVGVGGVLQMDASTETFWECGALFLSSSQVVGLAKGEDGSVWVTERNTGLCKISDGKLHYMEDYSRVSWNAGWLNGKIAVDNAHQCVWEAQYLGGELRKYNMKDSVITVENYSDGLIPLAKAYDVMMGEDGTLWVSSDNMLVNRKNEENHYFPTDEGYSIAVLDQDEAGAVWGGTTNGYLLKFDGEQYEYIDLADNGQTIEELKCEGYSLRMDKENSKLVVISPNTEVVSIEILGINGIKLMSLSSLVVSNQVVEIDLQGLPQNRSYLIVLKGESGTYVKKVVG